MKPDTALDYAVFQLSPKRSSCELLALVDGKTEKLASGLVKPFMTHLKLVEEQVALRVESIKLEAETCKNSEAWFTKGTLERFVRFVSTPEVLELVTSFDAEMCQLEVARKIYFQGAENQISGGSGHNRKETSAADATKNELLRAMNVRLLAVRKDLTMACARAYAAGFSPHTVSELQVFADYFGAHRLNESCIKFLSLCQRRPDLFNNWKPSAEDNGLCSSCESGMSIDDLSREQRGSQSEAAQATQQLCSQSKPSMHQQTKPFPPKLLITKDDDILKEKQDSPKESSPSQTGQPARRLSVQDRINLFENKQKENTGGKPVAGKPAELRRLSADVSSVTTPEGAAEKAVFRRLSGTSDMSIDSSGSDKKDSMEGPLCTPSSSVSHTKSNTVSKDPTGLCEMTSSVEVEDESHSSTSDSGSKIQADSLPREEASSGKEEPKAFKGRINLKTQRGSQNQYGSFTKKDRESTGVSKEVSSQEELKACEGPQEQSGGLKIQVGMGTQLRSVMDRSGPTGSKNSGRRNGSGQIYGETVPSGRMIPSRKESFSRDSTVPVEQAQKARQSKGNQKLNDELKTKANELEKLFAEHKQRVPGDMSNSIHGNRAADVQTEQEVNIQYRKTIAGSQQSENDVMTTPLGNGTKLSFELDKKTEVRPDDYSSSLRQDFSKLGFSDGSRGKSYESYMQKRDAKLREQWSAKRLENEAKLKVLQDSLERTRTELKAKLSGSVDRQDSVSGTCKHDRLKSFNVQSIRKLDESEKDEDFLESSLHKSYGPDRLHNDTISEKVALRSTLSNKALHNRNIPASTPRTRTGTSPIPTASVASNSNSGKRRMRSENPLVRSVPNFSNFRNENTKPAAGISKMMNRTEVRNYHSKSSIEETPQLKVEKPRRSHSLRKGSSGSLDFKDVSSLISDGVVLAPLELDKNQADKSFDENFQADVESKPFSESIIGMGGSSAGTSFSKLADSVAAETFEDERDNPAFEREDRKQEQAELETLDMEDFLIVDNDKSRPTADSDKLDDAGSENGDSSKSLSQDSPMGSPASWNSQLLNQTEVDVARMRKRWGSTQKSVLVNSSENKSRKDVTKGFKRLLNFGRKSRGAENLADWISVTTSEGDDETEYGRDHISQSSEDLKKSRMGSSQGHPADVGFNEGEVFGGQVQGLQSSIPAPPAKFKLREDQLLGSSLKAPRSFFSLSSFRSKGSDSKIR